MSSSSDNTNVVTSSPTTTRVYTKHRLATAEFGKRVSGQDMVFTLIAPVDGHFDSISQVFEYLKASVLELLNQDSWKKLHLKKELPAYMIDSHLGEKLFNDLSDKVSMFTYGVSIKHENVLGSSPNTQSGSLVTYNFQVQP